MDPNIGFSNPGGRLPPVDVPDHELIRLIGEGSYGQVWIARNTIGTYRAIKIIQRSSFKHERPFEREIEGIKQFEPISRTHPGLVAILHVGRSSDGDCFYYVMELGDDINTGTDIEPETYQGKTLASAVWDRGALSADRCIDLGLSLSDALAHLHSKDLIHRDVKPANIIFVAGYPKLADIGLVTEAHTASTYVGTEGFIPPEGPNSPQGDVFSLGKTLYEILTGQDRNQFPALPASFANDGQADSNYVELIEIINHACHHDRTIRYASARAMHAEITALANGRSIRRLRLLERRMSFVSRFSKLAALFLLPCLLVAYTIHREWQGRLQDLHRDIGIFEGMAANEMSAGDLSTALLHVGQAFGLAPYDESNASLQRIRAGTLFDSSPTLTHFWLSDASINRIEFDRANEFLFVAGDSGLVGRYSLAEDALTRFVGHIKDVRDIALHEESGRLLSVGGDHTVRLWDLESGKELRVFDQAADLWCVKFSPDGRMAFSGGAVSPEGGSIYRWNLDGSGRGTPSHIYPHLEKAWDLEISADGGILAAVLGSSVVLREIESGQVIGKPLVHSRVVYDIRFVDNDKRIITACHDGHFRVWDLKSGNVVYLSQPQDFPVRGVDTSPDGRFIATAGWDSVLRFWERPNGNMAQSILRHSGRVNAVRFGASGHKVATACTDGTLRIWNLAGQQTPSLLEGGWIAHHNGFAVRLYEEKIDLRKFGERIEMPEIRRESDEESKVLLTERGDFLVVQESHVGSDYVISLVDLDQEGFASRQLKINFDDGLNFADVDRERMNLTVGGQNTVQVYDIASGQSDWSPIKMEHEIQRTFLSHSGEQLIVQSSQEVSVVDIDGLSLIQGPIRTGNKLVYSEVSADDSILAVCESDTGLDSRSVFLYRFGDSSEPVAELKHGDSVQKVAFHPNGHELVTASEDGAAVIWDTKTGKPLYRVLRHRAPVQDVVYTEDGRFILTSSSDRTVRLWDAASGFPVTPPFLNPWSIGFGTVDPSAKEILCMTSGGGLAWIWRIEDCDYDSDLIVDYGRLLSGNQLSAETSTEEIYEWWRSGRSGSSEDFSVSQSDIVDWHRGQAFDALMSIMRFRGQFRWEDFDRLVKAEAFHVSRMEALDTPRNLSESNYSQRVRDKIRKEREALDTK